VAGHLACIGATLLCLDAVGPETATDGCNEDSNCNGLLENQPDLDSDVHHCGSCGNDCTQGAPHAIWTCESGGCVFNGCEPGWHDTQGNQTCAYYCVPTGPEVCNQVDDDCDGQIDEDVVPPPNARVNICGVSPAAQRPECTSQVGVTCVNGVWQCAFPANVCHPTCAAATEVCDALDNDCDGLLNENVSNFGRACLSDEGLPAPGHGACQTSGTYVCDGPSATRCTAVKASCATLPGGCEERCDGIDNDCDGLVDEDFTDKGSEAAYFVKPTVVKVAASVWMFSYEASRPNATSIDAGSGNGYHCSAGTCPAGVPDPPTGKPLERTLACSVQGKIPWFNVSPIEAEQTCAAIGGYLCTQAQWTTACQAREGGQDCLYGYAPNDAACRTVSTASKYCNLAAFDTDPATAGNQDAVIVTGSPSLQMCYADWGGLLANPASAPLYDITGNLREITEVGSGVYKLMGGSFISPTHDGVACTFAFYAVDGDTLAYDAGFRCCFSADPRL
jgi:hypothetical protein